MGQRRPVAGTPWWKGHWTPLSSTTPTGGMTVFEIVMGLTLFGVLYVAIIELREKCKQVYADADQDARSHHQVAP